MGRGGFCFLAILVGLSLKTGAQSAFTLKDTFIPTIKNQVLLPQNFYSQHLPFVCKKESQLQKLSGVNFFLRLGSKQYVDYMERKPNSWAGQFPDQPSKSIFQQH